MESDALHLALETARRSGMTPREALIHWDLAGGIAGGEQSVVWAIIAIDLAMEGRPAEAGRPTGHTVASA
ncbi:hypothetical protein [Sphingomonas oryzagri]